MKLLIAAAMAATVIAGGFLASAVASEPVRKTDTLGDHFMKLTRGSQWTPAGEIKVQFDTFHPQGMVKIGDDFFVSSVNIIQKPAKYDAPRDGYDRDTGRGEGHLFKIGPDGKLLGDLKLGDGTMYHPGGIDFDGKHIWVPAAEYRPNSRSVIYRVDPQTMTSEKMFTFADHIGGLVHDTETSTLHGVSWGSRRFYAWPLGDDGQPKNAEAEPAKLRVLNPAQYIDYQDCHSAGASRMLCSGLNTYRTSPDAKPFSLGGMELVDFSDNRPVWQLPVEKWAPSGLPMTQNPFFVEPHGEGLRAWFMPDDDTSTIFVFDIAAAK